MATAEGRVRRRQLAAALLAALAAVALGVTAWEAGGDLAVVAGSLLVVLVSAPTALRLRTDLLDAPGIYAAISAVFFGPLSLAWVGSRPVLPAPALTQVDIGHALVLVAVSLAAFGAAARLTGRAQPRPVPALSPRSKVPVLSFVGLLVIGGLGVAVGLSLGAIGVDGDAGAGSGVLAIAQAFQQLSLLGAMAVFACAIWTFRQERDRRLEWLLVALAGAQALAGFASGYKQNALLPVLFVMAAYVVCRGRVPWRPALAGALVAVLVLLPATILYRDRLNASGTASAGGPSPSRLVSESTEYLQLRFRLVDHVALIQANTPSVYAFGSGRRYALLPALVLFPRAVWPDKPVLEDGLEFSHTYWQVPLGIRTSTPLTQPGDLYRNFGAGGAIAGLAAWGLVLGLAARSSRRFPGPRVAMVYGVALVTTFAFVEADLPTLVTSASRTLVVACLVAWLLLPGRRDTTGVALLAGRAGRLLAAGRAATQGRRTEPDPG